MDETIHDFKSCNYVRMFGSIPICELNVKPCFRCSDRECIAERKKNERK